jgi:TPR repeat protein
MVNTNRVRRFVVLSIPLVVALAATTIATSFRHAPASITGLIDSEAERLFVAARQAAAVGDAVAQTKLGDLYVQGLGVDQNYTEAAWLYRVAAGKGYAVAQFNLGMMHEQGRGVARNDAEAIRLIRLASNQGFETARLELAAMCSRGINEAC